MIATVLISHTSKVLLQQAGQNPDLLQQHQSKDQNNCQQIQWKHGAHPASPPTIGTLNQSRGHKKKAAFPVCTAALIASLTHFPYPDLQSEADAQRLQLPSHQLPSPLPLTPPSAIPATTFLTSGFHTCRKSFSVQLRHEPILFFTDE